MIGFSFTVDVASFFAILFYCRIEDLRTLADPIAQQGFVNGRPVGELTRAAAGLPATNAQFCRWQWPKPMQVECKVQVSVLTIDTNCFLSFFTQQV